MPLRIPLTVEPAIASKSLDFDRKGNGRVSDGVFFADDGATSSSSGMRYSKSLDRVRVGGVLGDALIDAVVGESTCIMLVALEYEFDDEESLRAALESFTVPVALICLIRNDDGFE